MARLSSDTGGGVADQEGSLASSSRPSPLAVSYPSPMLLVNYPLVVNNIKVLCDKGDGRAKSPSLAGTIRSLRETHRLEGLAGLYRGGVVYIFHQALRDSLRFLAEGCFNFIERRLGFDSFARPALQAEDTSEKSLEEADTARRKRFYSRLATKYFIDALCYPVLFASTRAVVLRCDQESTWHRLCYWCREEGFWSLFGGLTASLLSTAFEEAMEALLSWSIDKSAQGSNIEMSDKVLLKICGGSVVSVFTTPINYVGTIQRCQSYLPGLLQPQPLWPTLRGLPWRGSFYQLLTYGGLLALNVRMVQWKLELQEEQQDDTDE